MFPNAVHDRSRECRGLPIRYPIGQLDSPIAALVVELGHDPKRPRSHGFAALGIIHFAMSADLDAFSLPRNAGEAGGEPVIIFLRPAVSGMSVTARTGDLSAQENATDVFGQVPRIGRQSEEVCRWIVAEIAP